MRLTAATCASLPRVPPADKTRRIGVGMEEPTRGAGTKLAERALWVRDTPCVAIARPERMRHSIPGREGCAAASATSSPGTDLLSTAPED